MSYDLYFKCKKDKTLSKIEFIDYFKNRQWYNIEEKQAMYDNEDTGVYFVFDFNGEDAIDSEIFEEDIHSVASININYNRPHIFALEADYEIRNFIEEFELDIFDPQMNGMGEGPYSREGFIRGWNEGNIFGIHAINQEDNYENILTLPYNDIECYWKWSLSRELLQDEIGDDIFVPRVMYIVVQNEVKSVIAWSDAIPVVLPKVDLVVLFKKQLAPFNLFGKKPVLSVVDYEDVSKLFPTKEETTDQGITYKILENSSQKIRDFFREQKPMEIKAISIDNILDAEFVEKAKKMVTSSL